MTFGTFVAEQFVPNMMPTFKPSTRSGYISLLKKHLIPRFENHRLCDFNKPEIQGFTLAKLQNENYSWEMANRILDLLSARFSAPL